jgi:hypothetical protein
MQSNVSELHPGMDHFRGTETSDEWMIPKMMFRRLLQLICQKSQSVEGRNATCCRNLIRPSAIVDNGKLVNRKCDMMQQYHSDKDLCNSNADQDIARLKRPMNLQIPTKSQSDCFPMMNWLI